MLANKETCHTLSVRSEEVGNERSILNCVLQIGQRVTSASGCHRGRMTSGRGGGCRLWLGGVCGKIGVCLLNEDESSLWEDEFEDALVLMDADAGASTEPTPS